MEKDLRENHPPRHVRLSCNEQLGPSFDFATHEVVEDVPMLDELGHVVSSERVVKKVLVSDSLGKYKLDDFKLENLVRAGVPLNEMSVDTYNSLREEELLSKAKAAGVLLESFQSQPDPQPDPQPQSDPQN